MMKHDDPTLLLSQSRNLALRLVADPSVADDLAQEAWLVLRKRGDLGVADFNAYLAGIVRNLSRRWLRTSATRQRYERLVARREVQPSTPRDLDTTLDMHRDLVEEVRSLPVPLREVIQLRFYEDLSAAEVARRLGIPASTVRSRVNRGLVVLRSGFDSRHKGERRVWATLLMGLPVQEEVGLGAGGATGGFVGAGILVTALVLFTVAFKSMFMAPSDEGILKLAVEHELPVRVSLGIPELELAAPLAVSVPVSGRPRSARSEIARSAEGAVTVGDGVPFRIVRVVDRATGNPLPEYTVHTTNEKGSGRYAVTDDKGEFIFRDPAGKWDRVLVAKDHDSLQFENLQRWNMGEVARANLGRTVDFFVDVGPTYRFQIPSSAPQGLALQSDPDARSIAVITNSPPAVVLRASLASRGFEPRIPRAKQNLDTVVRGGSAPFVRFAPGVNYEEALGPPPWYLRLSDDEGLWQVWGEIDSVQGEHQGVIAFEGGAFGRLQVVMEYPNRLSGGSLSTPVPTAWLLNSNGEHQMVQSASGLFPDGPKHTPVWNFLAPGRYTLRAGGDIHEQQVHEVVIEKGKTTRLELDLKRRSGGRDISVILCSESGTLDFSGLGATLRPTLTSQGGNRHCLPVKSALVPEQVRFVFLFENVAPGPWKLELRESSHLPDFQPSQDRLIGADESEVLLTCLDHNIEPMVTPRVAVVDALTGEPVEDASINLWVRGEMYGTSSHIAIRDGSGRESATGRTMRTLPQGTPFACAVSAEGYQPLFIPNGTYPPQLPGSEVGEFRMQPGWGRVVYAVTRELVGIPGVEVFADGQPIGTTDATGCFLLIADRPSAEIHVDHPEYKHIAGSIHPQTGRPHEKELPQLVYVIMEAR